MNAEPTKEQLTAMAYADGELEAADRREFEELMTSRPDLAREVAQLQRLQVLARQVAGPEPMDVEWERLGHDPVHRAGGGLGMGLLLFGTLGVLLWSMFEILRADDVPVWGKLCLGGLLAGALLLMFTTLRARLRTLPFDPYTEVKR